MGDPCGSFFPTTKSSQELTGSGPRGVKGAGFSFDPLPKRTKRSRTIEASLDKHEVPEKRREPQKVEVAKDEKNLGDADSKTYKHEELLPRDKVKVSFLRGGQLLEGLLIRPCVDFDQMGLRALSEELVLPFVILYMSLVHAWSCWFHDTIPHHVFCPIK